VPVEVKGNWHDEVITAIESQLGDRYLQGPHGTTGIYVVGFYRGKAWGGVDVGRRTAAGRRDRQELLAELELRSAALAKRGMTVHVRVVDLTLGADQASDPA
jgi:hypothetical protein